MWRVRLFLPVFCICSFIAWGQNLLSQDIPAGAPASGNLRKLSPDLRVAAQRGGDDFIIVCALVREGVQVERYMERSAPGRVIGEMQTITGEIRPSNLVKLANVDGVITIISTETYRPVEAPGEDELRAQPRPDITLPADLPPSPQTIKTREIHKASAAWTKGYTGTGVVAGLVDTGVDFSHPDLQGIQARVSSGPYAGWPYSYDTLSVLRYAINSADTLGPDNIAATLGSTWYVHTTDVPSYHMVGDTCYADLTLDVTTSPVTIYWHNTSKSGNYKFSVHPDIALSNAARNLGMGYATRNIPAAVILSDETAEGIYDTVYVDIDYNGDVRDSKPMRKGDELAGADIFKADGSWGADGVWDLSAGMLAWISDGVNPPPGLAVTYPTRVTVPGAGRLLVFIGDSSDHGTHCAGDIAGQSRITDPSALGTINPLFAGGSAVGGVGGAVLSGMAPGAKIAALQNGFGLPFDAWIISIFGFDGTPQSGDECQIINNSWGGSNVINDGWDYTSRYASYLNEYIAPRATFVVSTGNGGHGFGTATEPGSVTSLNVGASTSYGSTLDFEFVSPSRFLWGDVQPWSNRGPGMLGNCAPNVLGVGAWGTGCGPLNVITPTGMNNGQSAYNQFGGTSMAAPIASGISALVYQAYKNRHGLFPKWQDSVAMLMNSCNDLGYDVLAQGAGNLDADRATDVAAGKGLRVEPEQIVAGAFHGADYPAFPHIMHPGDTDNVTLSFFNDSVITNTISLSSLELTQVSDLYLTISLPAGSPPDMRTPTWVTDITPLITTNDPDLLRVQVVYPYTTFDINGDYNYENSWRVLLYDWTDLNRDGRFWNDANFNGVVDPGEMPLDPATSQSEHLRFTYGYPRGTYLEASVGRESLSRRHNGVLLGLQRRSGTDACEFTIRMTCYKQSACPWIKLSARGISVGPGATGTVDAAIYSGSTERLGLYQAGIYASYGGMTTLVPVIKHVAANSNQFRFGTETPGEPPDGYTYDNGHIFGGFDWSWRYESGDWRLFFFDTPQGTARPGRKIIVDTRWSATPTDIDTWVYGPNPDAYSFFDPTFFGPYGVSMTGGSADSYIGSGIFRFNTSTGGAREIISADIRDGLNFIALHNVLYGDMMPAQSYTGTTYQVDTLPYPVVQYGHTGTWNQAFISTADMDTGLTVTTYGLSQPLALANQTAYQDNPSNMCTASWVYTLDINNCGMIEINTTSPVPGLDIDLLLFRDTGSGVWECPGDPLIASSSSGTAAEYIKVTHPSNARYFVVVHGWIVPGGSAPFDITIQAIQGSDITLVGAPPPFITHDTTYTLQFQWTAPGPGTWEGQILLGPPAAPATLAIPVTVHATYADLSIIKYAVPNPAQALAPLTYNFQVINFGPDEVTTLTITDILPHNVELIYAQSYDPATRIANVITWNDPLPAGWTLTVNGYLRVRPDDGSTSVVNTCEVLSSLPDPDPSNNTYTTTTMLLPAFQSWRDDTFTTGAVEPPGLYGWSSFGFNDALAWPDYNAATHSYRAHITGNPSLYRASGVIANWGEWMPYSNVYTDKYVRVKYYVYAGGQSNPGDGTQIPNMRMRAQTRFAVNSMLEVFNHTNDFSQAQTDMEQELRPSANPANPSLYRVDFDPVDAPCLTDNAAVEGIQRAFEAYAIYPQDNGYVAMCESQIGTYPNSTLSDVGAPAKVYAPSAGGAGDLAVKFPGELDIANMIPGAGEGVFPTRDTAATPEQLPTHTESADGITIDSANVPLDRVGILSREFTPATTYTEVLRVEAGRQYKIRWHIASTQFTNQQCQVRMRGRSIKFGWSQKLEVGGAWAAGSFSNTIAQQVLPGDGCMNPDHRTGETTGGWYTLLMHTPMSADIRPEFPAGTPLTIRMPNICAQPGPGVDAASQRDLRVGFDLIDTISGGAQRDLERGNFLLDRIEVRIYDLVAD